jgi:hypothetical protein
MGRVIRHDFFFPVFKIYTKKYLKKYCLEVTFLPIFVATRNNIFLTNLNRFYYVERI